MGLKQTKAMAGEARYYEQHRNQPRGWSALMGFSSG